jgi:hypothetical protein
VTYPLHIILRYEVERGLLDGSIKVDDVPAVWNAKMKQYLGVEPPTDAQGCLQVGRTGCRSLEVADCIRQCVVWDRDRQVLGSRSTQ